MNSLLKKPFFKSWNILPSERLQPGGHENPVAAGLVNFAEEYKYSFPKSSGQAAKFYLDGIDEFDMISHYSGN